MSDVMKSVTNPVKSIILNSTTISRKMKIPVYGALHVSSLMFPSRKLTTKLKNKLQTNKQTNYYNVDIRT